MKVQVSITENVRYSAIVEMSKEDYEKWCERIDNSRGFEREEVGQELLELTGSSPNDGDYTDIEVEDFCEVEG